MANFIFKKFNRLSGAFNGIDTSCELTLEWAYRLRLSISVAQERCFIDYHSYKQNDLESTRWRSRSGGRDWRFEGIC